MGGRGTGSARRPMPVARRAAAAIALLAVSACTSTAAPRPQETRPSPRTTPSEDLPSTLWTPTTSTDGNLHRLGLYGGPTKGGGTAAITGVSSSTQLVTRAEPKPGATGPLLTGTTKVGWLVDDRPIPIAAPAPPGPSQLVAADVHDDTVVWRDTRSTNLEAEDWRILAQSPDGGPDARVIASYDDYYEPDDVPMLNPDRHPLALVGDRAYWSIADWPTEDPHAPRRRPGLYPDRPTHRILSTSIDGSEPIQQVAHGAYGPARAGDRLLYIADDRLETGRSSGTVTITEVDGARSRAVHRLDASDETTSITMTCGTDTYVSWAATVRGRDEINVLVDGEARPHRIPLRSTGSVTEISCGDRFVAWGRGSGRGDPGLYLYDVPTKHKANLGTTQAYGRVYAQGDTLAYPEKTIGTRPGRWVVATWRP